MHNKPTFHSFKKTANGQIFVQWKKGGKFCLVEGEVATFILWASLQ
jgi:hypothetical protein